MGQTAISGAKADKKEGMLCTRGGLGLGWEKRELYIVVGQKAEYLGINSSKLVNWVVGIGGDLAWVKTIYLKIKTINIF